MIIDRLVITDFGVYAGRHDIELTPPSASKPVILIGGLNGGGKTTFLDAIQLCLHGKFASCSNRGDLGYSEYLRRSIHRDSPASGAQIELTFRHKTDGAESSYRIVRSWLANGKGVSENFDVTRNGESDPFLAECWTQLVEMILPRRIANLFLFDGEKIEAYASPENASQLLATATHTLLGMDIVGQLERDLDTLKHRKNQAVSDEGLNNDVKLARTEYEQILQEYRDKQQTIAALRTHDRIQAQKTLEAIEYEFRQRGGEIFEREQEIEQELVETKRQQEEIEADLREIASQDAPLLLVQELLGNVRERVLNEKSAAVNREFIDEARKRDERLTALLKTLTKKEPLIGAITDFLGKDLDERTEMTGCANVIELSSAGTGALDQLLRRELDEVKDRLLEKLDELQKTLAIRQRKETEKASIPAEETIRDLIETRDEAKISLQKIDERIRALEHDMQRLHTSRIRGKQRLSKLLERKVRADFEKRDDTRILVHASRVQHTLREFRKRAIAQHLGRIEGLIADSFQTLLRKDSLFKSVKIDPESFRMMLIDPTERELSPERLSAGERQLLAVAIVWALAQASNRQLPTVVDTPLGRLDGQHRKNLVSRYFPNAGQQVILLSTDEEIVGDHYAELAASVGRTYELVFDEATRSTMVRQGYFQRERELAD